MPKFQVSRTVHIVAAVDEVYSKVRDFREWPSWSPWLIAEPEVELEFGEDGRSYRWEGVVAGAGTMLLEREEANRSLSYTLALSKPWKSLSQVEFIFSETNGGTDVTWKLDGSLPFFMFWMTGTMTAFIGADYERGLNLLKAVVEKGEHPSKLDFIGKKQFRGCRYMGVRTLCDMAETGERMCADLTKLNDWVKAGELVPSGPPFSIYHKWDPAKEKVEYTIALPMAALPPDLGEEFVGEEIPACKAYLVQHTGPYQYVGNAWASGMMRERADIFVADNKIDMFEIYENDPRDVPAEELVTTLYFPMK